MSNELKRVDVRLNISESNSLFSEEEIRSPEDAVRIMADVMAELDREHVCVLNMDAKGHPINFNIVSIGDINTSLVPSSNVFKTAILSNAASVLVLHNHPSSSNKPSEDDLRVTKKLMYAGVVMDIPVIDHIIVAGRTGKCYSMLANNPDLMDRKQYSKTLSYSLESAEPSLAMEVMEAATIYEATPKMQKYGIYQINEDSPGKEYIFQGTDMAKKLGKEISGKDYNLVYSGEIGEHESLDSIYEMFNINRPEDFKGHSLSVSDVIALIGENETKAYYVDSYGFTELPNFVKQREELIHGGRKEQKKEYKSRAEGVKEITEKLEQGIKELFESDKYKEYLDTMAKFYNYSFNNTLLIAMQRPDATLVASYGSWQKNFNRHVMQGEKGIRIFAPAPYKVKEEREVVGPDGTKCIEVVEETRQAFKALSVFDVSQTEGEPIPTVGAEELLQSVDGYQDLKTAIEEVTPVPVTFKEILGNAKGYFSKDEKLIAIQKDMSESQTLKTLVHEVAHSMLHDPSYDDEDSPFVEKDRKTKEVEAESVAYTVCKHFGIDTEDYSFSYVAGWSENKEMKELKSSMETIRATSAKLIKEIGEKIHTLREERAMEHETQLLIGEKVREKLEHKTPDLAQNKNKTRTMVG